MNEAEAQGLTRMSAQDLKGLIQGTIEYPGIKKSTVLVLNSDGSVIRNSDLTGKWRIDEKNNSYCTVFAFEKGDAENCFAVCRAADGDHYFGHDIDAGYDVHVWRRSP
jgi:hypothetical protein